MANGSLEAGSTLLIPSGDVNHLFVILIGPIAMDSYGTAPQLLMVNLTSAPSQPKVPFDQTCIVDIGDHPFVGHRSYAAYRYLRIDSLSHAEQMVSQGLWIEKERCSEIFLERLKSGVCVSKFTNREFKKLFNC
jgi:hypothetical protein